MKFEFDSLRLITVFTSAGLATLAGHSKAHENHATVLQELVVFGRSLQLVGSAGSASEGLVGYADIQLPPLLRVGELAEAVPGMVATQHSGTGKANQYYLRGFNLDHGTDFSASLDGVPLNMRTHGHGQGYLDLNFMIPELVATTRYRKGTYAAEDGDFSSAGSVSFDYYDRLAEPFIEFSLGEFGYQRGLLAGSKTLASGEFTGALDITRYEGPWSLDEDLEQEKFYASYRTEIAGRETKFDLHGYFGDWNATDQIPLRAVDAGIVTPFDYIDPDLGGDTRRLSLNAEMSFDSFRVNAYAIDYDFSLFSNFTYFLEDPLQGDEFEQRDSRQIYGLNVNGDLEGLFSETAFRLRWGAEARWDDINELALFQTSQRQRMNAVRQDSVNEGSIGLYSDLEFSLSERLRLGVGARLDYYDWKVQARRSINNGSGDDSQISPKLRLAYKLADGLELYGNYGRGMHSNDVRGASIVIDPISEEAVDPVEVLVPSLGAELGLRFERENFNATLVAYWLEIDSELVFVGDAGGTEANDGSERTGFEAAAFWQLNDWLTVNADYSQTDAEYQNLLAGMNAIPGAIESSFSLGVNAMFNSGFSSSLQLRYLGESPLTEDDTVRAPSSTLVNLGVGYAVDRFEWRFELFNAIDSDDYDIAYYYASRLAGEQEGGIEDIHFHPLEPRSARLSVQYKF